MKYRIGFVTNSSSSSFICDVCGKVESGYDASLREFGMFQCECGAIYCEEHKIKKITKQHKINYIKSHNEASKFIPFNKTSDEAIDKLLFDLGLDLENETLYGYEFDECEYPSIYCPFCNMQEMYDQDIIRYLLKNSTETVTSIKKEIRKKYHSYEEFLDDIK